MKKIIFPAVNEDGKIIKLIPHSSATDKNRRKTELIKKQEKPTTITKELLFNQYVFFNNLMKG